MIKKLVSLLMIVSLVISLASILGACGKKDGTKSDAAGTKAAQKADDKKGKEKGKDAEDEPENAQEAFEEMFSNLSTTEHTTNEYYKEDYEALTLPSPTKPGAPSGEPVAVAPTNPAVRETTTKNRMFSYGSPDTTTAKAGTATTAAAGGTTAQASGTTQPIEKPTVTDTTLMADPIPAYGVGMEGTAQQRPNVTYFDKYVQGILNGKSYSAKLEWVSDEGVVPMSYYVDGNNRALVFSLTEQLSKEMGIKMPEKITELRIIVKKDDMYLNTALGYVSYNDMAKQMNEGKKLEDAEIKNFESLLDEFDEAGGFTKMLDVLNKSMDYCGLTLGNGYVAETYEAPDKSEGYTFYFTSSGLTKFEQFVPGTRQILSSTVCELTSGVDDKSVFKTTGKKLNLEDAEAIFGSFMEG